MARRAVDLSLDELAALGAAAGLEAARQSQAAGLTVMGTVDVLENGKRVSKLARQLPSGEIVLLEHSHPVTAKTVVSQGG